MDYEVELGQNQEGNGDMTATMAAAYLDDAVVGRRGDAAAANRTIIIITKGEAATAIVAVVVRLATLSYRPSR